MSRDGAEPSAGVEHPGVTTCRRCDIRILGADRADWVEHIEEEHPGCIDPAGLADIIYLGGPRIPCPECRSLETYDGKDFFDCSNCEYRVVGSQYPQRVEKDLWERELNV